MPSDRIWRIIFCLRSLSDSDVAPLRFSQLLDEKADLMEPIAYSWAPQGTFHHVGVVVASIQNVVEGYARAIDADWDGAIIHDPHQMVRVTFLQSKIAGNPLLELVEPAGEKSPVLAFVKRGGGIHHVCYVVDSLEKQLELCRSRNMVVLRPPLPAAAFNNRRIAWVCTADKFLIEYLER